MHVCMERWPIENHDVNVTQSPSQNKGFIYLLTYNNVTNKIMRHLERKTTLLMNLGRVSCSNYFMSIHILRFSVKLIKIVKPDTKIFIEKHNVSSQSTCPMQECHHKLECFQEKPRTVSE